MLDGQCLSTANDEARHTSDALPERSWRGDAAHETFKELMSDFPGSKLVICVGAFQAEYWRQVHNLSLPSSNLLFVKVLIGGMVSKHHQISSIASRASNRIAKGINT